MVRYAKTYAQPTKPEVIPPRSNKFTIDLAGLELTDEQLSKIRSEAVRSAMLSAANILADRARLWDDFGTFSTFSTFGLFASGAFEALPAAARELPAELAPEARRAIEQTLGTSKS